MQDFEITQTEKYGSLWNIPQHHIIGKCSASHCPHPEIFSECEYFFDTEGNLFCCREHADKFHGIYSSDLGGVIL